MISQKITINDIENDSSDQMLSKFLGQADPDQFNDLKLRQQIYLRQIIRIYEEKRTFNENWRSREQAQNLLQKREIQYQKQRAQIQKRLNEIFQRDNRQSILLKKMEQLTNKTLTCSKSQQQKKVFKVSCLIEPFKNIFKRNHGLQQIKMIQEEQYRLYKKQHLKKQ